MSQPLEEVTQLNVHLLTQIQPHWLVFQQISGAEFERGLRNQIPILSYVFFHLLGRLFVLWGRDWWKWWEDLLVSLVGLLLLLVLQNGLGFHWCGRYVWMIVDIWQIEWLRMCVHIFRIIWKQIILKRYLCILFSNIYCMIFNNFEFIMYHLYCKVISCC